MLRPKIGLDRDDVTAPFTVDPPWQMKNIISIRRFGLRRLISGNRGRTGIIREFYEDEELMHARFRRKNKKAVYRLMKLRMFILSLRWTAFMGIRAKQILTAFQIRLEYYSGQCQVSGAVWYHPGWCAIHNVLESTGHVSGASVSWTGRWQDSCPWIRWVNLFLWSGRSSMPRRRAKQREIKTIGSGTGMTVRFRKRRIDQNIMSGSPLCQSENLLHQEK